MVKLTGLKSARDVSSVRSTSTGRTEDSLTILQESALELHSIVARVSPEEFHWQESRYDHDSRHGRELLFLIANHDWVRATSEITNIVRSDAVETTIKIDIDLDQITHEAFMKRTGRFWLPVAVLPPQTALDTQQEAGQRRLEPDPFATVTDAAGNLLPMLPTPDARHQMSAAMAEIIVNMAVARWPGPDQERPTATRDQRLLLSAAIYRLLRRGPQRNRVAGGPADELGMRPASGAGHGDGAHADSRTQAPVSSPIMAPADSGNRTSASRIDKAREQLLKLLDSYNELIGTPSRSQPDGDDVSGLEAPQFVPELVRRAVKVLTALTESMVVVVPVNRETTPTVVTVRVPTRALKASHLGQAARPSMWGIRPRGCLEVDVLLPTADADRQIQIHLPDGVSFEPGGHEAADMGRPRLDISVKRPQPFKELALLISQILDPSQHEWSSPLRRCLADLAQRKTAAARETLRHYEASSASDQPPADSHQASTSAARATLDELSIELNSPSRDDSVARIKLADIRDRFARDTSHLVRRTSADRTSSRTVVTRADMIEEVSQRATPITAKVRVGVVVTDDEYFSIARLSGGMSLLLMIMVLGFLLAARFIRHGALPSPEVLAIVLTLFSAIQAGQMERPDRSSLHGLMSAAGNWLIAASILPAVTLAVALAFPWAGWVPTCWAAGCVIGQVLFQVAMHRSPETVTGSPPTGQRWKFCTHSPDYRHFEALRSDYWRSTTADALMIGRTAYGYVIWQKTRIPQLKPLLSWQTDTTDPAQPVNVLALLHASTFGQATTFIVFRDEPTGNWAKGAAVEEKVDVDLDPNRLAPTESITSIVDVFVGIDRWKKLTICAHPLAGILRAAAHRLIVLDAQLPVPTPVPGHEGRLWARVRVGLRNAEDIRRLPSFLHAVHRCTEKAPPGYDCVAAVQTIPTVAPRIIAASGSTLRGSSRGGRLILTSALDVVNIGGRSSKSTDAESWRVLTICADARSNIESDIVQGLAATRPDLELAGLTYGLLHGMAVIVMLLHEPSALHGYNADDIESDLQHKLAMTKLRVLVNKRLNQGELRAAGEYPMLRIHFRWQDRPGALLNVLTSLGTALSKGSLSIEPGDWSVSYARTQAAAGRSALARLTIRIHDRPADIASWRPGQLEEIGRKVRTLAAQDAAKRISTFVGHELDPPEDPVVSIDLIKTPIDD